VLQSKPSKASDLLIFSGTKGILYVSNPVPLVETRGCHHHGGGIRGSNLYPASGAPHAQDDKNMGKLVEFDGL